MWAVTPHPGLEGKENTVFWNFLILTLNWTDWPGPRWHLPGPAHGPDQGPLPLGSDGWFDQECSGWRFYMQRTPLLPAWWLKTRPHRFFASSRSENGVHEASEFTEEATQAPPCLPASEPTMIKAGCTREAPGSFNTALCVAPKPCLVQTHQSPWARSPGTGLYKRQRVAQNH